MGQPASAPRLEFGGFTIDFARQALVRDGSPVFLRPQSFQVLCHLVEHRGELVTKDELFQEVWGNTVVTDDSLTQCLVEIRKALGKRDRSLIRTLPRRGYIFEGTPVEPPAASTVATRSRRRLALPLAGLLLVAAVITFLIRLSHQPDSAPFGSADQAGSTVVAVLPFRDFTRSGENAYLGYGLAEETLNRLTLVSGLKVIARTSSFALAKEEGLTMSELANRLGATHVVEGSVREHGSALRITAQLIETATGFHLWSESFDRDPRDLLRVQDQIASAIAAVLDVGTTDRPPPGGTISAADYTHFLKASFLLIADDLASLQEARHLLEGVVARNPHHLPSIEKLFRIYRYQFLIREIDADTAISLIEGLALSLAEFEPAALIVHTARGEAALQITGDLPQAAEHLGAALALSTADPSTLRAGGELAHALGRYDDAIMLYRAALALDPLCGFCHFDLAYAYLGKGWLDRAEWSIREFMKFSLGGHFSLAMVKILQGEFEAAAEALETPVPQHMQRYRDYYQALLSFAAGDVETYRELREGLVQIHGDTESVRIAQLYAWGGQMDEANDWALRAAERDPAQLRQSLQEPAWAGLREDRDFLALLTRLGRAPAQLEAIEFEVEESALTGLNRPEEP